MLQLCWTDHSIMATSLLDPVDALFRLPPPQSAHRRTARTTTGAQLEPRRVDAFFKPGSCPVGGTALDRLRAGRTVAATWDSRPIPTRRWERLGCHRRGKPSIRL